MKKLEKLEGDAKMLEVEYKENFERQNELEQSIYAEEKRKETKELKSRITELKNKIEIKDCELIRLRSRFVDLRYTISIQDWHSEQIAMLTYDNMNLRNILNNSE
ncbi:hypothetical protein F8M41_014631 [Gigaspora margarita]|uniref:Uncharacterized protein n=1 Tax=Gigaspora margarita TaxID=4874 RepID=A0A8H4B3H7_GIGMA|nr:hypothetical protein F8M41_014631 [Gigaspora margarita]